MNLKTMTAAIVLAGLSFASAAAAEGTHDSRIAMMKKIGRAAGTLAGIAKGENAYNAEEVKAALATIAETAKAFPDQFGPGGDKSDPEVNAKIWNNMDDFRAKADKLSSNAETALAQFPVDAAGVGAVLKTIAPDCGACHQSYRARR